MASAEWSYSRATTASTPSPFHPLDPVVPNEIEHAVAITRAAHPGKRLAFNTVTLAEPTKEAMLRWLSNKSAPMPERIVQVAVIEGGTHSLFEGLVSLSRKTLISWVRRENVQPILSMEDLGAAEEIVRKDPGVIKQCGILGIPKEDMAKVYCDPWSIGYDERFGSGVRLQQALMYYRAHKDDNQYSHPLDFCPIIDTQEQKVVHIDVPDVRRPLSTAPHSNYMPEDVLRETGYRTDCKPINITQPEGVSFQVKGNLVEWQNWSVHVGFNYREGIVLNNITYNDHGVVRPIFYRMSLAEMVVPYGNPEHPHHRKHAFDLGEYGAGYMTNSLGLGCDCKGVIHYLDFHHANRAGKAETIKNAVCIHEEDSGVLFKHSDFRNNATIVTRGRKLIISHVFTPANYEYGVYWSFHQDGSIALDIKLTGILNTYSMNPGEDTKGWGTQVYPGVNAHNHQHLFCLRIDPMVDGQNNTVMQTDAVQAADEVGSAENKYGNAFYAKKTVFRTAKEAMADYDGQTSRTWDICNTNKLHPCSGKPASYKLVSREVPSLLPKEDGLVWKRAGFARHALHVTPYIDGQLYPAGNYVPQTSGEPSMGLPEWLAESDANIENTDIVLWHTFGLTHFPAPEDFPIMPAEPMGVLLRPRHFFLKNPALDVPPSFFKTPTQADEKAAVEDVTDHTSRLAFDSCCSSAKL